MDFNEEYVHLNLTTGDAESHSFKSRLSRNDRLRKSRDRRREVDHLVERELEKQKDKKVKARDSSSGGDVGGRGSPGPPEANPKRKQKKNVEDSADHGPAKRPRVSLFSSNPEIPTVPGVSVDPHKEEIFTTDTFGDLDLHPFMVSNLEEHMAMQHVTKVQQATIPLVLAGNDVLVKSQTGSGKTLSYAIPIIHMLQGQQPKVQRADGPYALVIVPTRELALQSLETFQKLVKPFQWIVPGCVMGGENRKAEKSRIRKGLNILISTPGRLLDHLEQTRNLSLAKVRWLVIDEADRLFDLGFEKEVSKAVSLLNEKCPDSRQTILLSATLSAGVERLAGMTMSEPTKVNLTQDVRPDPSNPKAAPVSIDDQFAVPEHLFHHFVVVPCKLRLVTLAAFVLWKAKMAKKKNKMLVFLSTQESVIFHHMLFKKCLASLRDGDSDGESGIEDEDEEATLNAYMLHGEMDQKERTKVFQSFCKATSGVLLCTDVAARGLDLPQVRWIVQLTAPATAKDYIHRVGRTARIGAKGSALLFLLPSEVEYVNVLAQYQINLEEVSMNDILRTQLIQPATGKKQPNAAHSIQETAATLQRRFMEYIEENKDVRSQARKAYQSFIKAYSSYPKDVRHIFHPKRLHLGHAATSFGLQEAPSKIGSIVGEQGQLTASGHRKDRGHSSSGKPSVRQKMKKNILSEFVSGLDLPKVKDSHMAKRKPLYQKGRIPFNKGGRPIRR